MTKPFSQLWNEMSPEQQARATETADGLRAASEQKRRADLYPELVEALNAWIDAPEDAETYDANLARAIAILAKCKEQS